MSLSESKIDYLTHVWNPAVGCLHGCEYCWLRRFLPRMKCELCRQKVPHLHPERLGDAQDRLPLPEVFKHFRR